MDGSQGSGNYNRPGSAHSRPDKFSYGKLTDKDHHDDVSAKKTSGGRSVTRQTPEDDDNEFDLLAKRKGEYGDQPPLNERTATEITPEHPKWVSFDEGDKAEDSPLSTEAWPKKMEGATEQDLWNPWVDRGDDEALSETPESFDALKFGTAATKGDIKEKEAAIAKNIKNIENEQDILISDLQRKEEQFETAIQRQLMEASKQEDSRINDETIKGLEVQIESIRFQTEVEVQKLQDAKEALNKQSIYRRRRQVVWDTRKAEAGELREQKKNEAEFSQALEISKQKAETTKQGILEQLELENLDDLNEIEKLRRQLLEVVNNDSIESKDKEAKDTETHNQIHRIHARMRARGTQAKNKTKAIDDSLRQQSRSFFKISEEKWRRQKPIVYSGEDTPFTIIPGKETASVASPEADTAMWKSGEFDDSAPLLTKTIMSYEPKLDKSGNPVLRRDEHNSPIPVLDEEGSPVTETYSVTDPETQKVTLENRPVYEYEPDLSKPVYGYDANTDASTRSVNKKKLKQYHVKSFSSLFKTLVGKAKQYYRKLTSSASAKAQRFIDKLLLNPKNVFHKSLQNPFFRHLFKQLCSKKYKQDVTGLQKLHDLTGVLLSEHIKFTPRESQGKYRDAMTTLLLVGAGVIDARAEEGDDYNYRLLDSPVEQVLEQQSASLESAEASKVARKMRGSRWTGTITPKHIKRIGKLVDEAVKAKEAVENSNELARQEGRTEDVQDADEVAKQTLINLVMKKRGGRLPTDLPNKIETMRSGNLWDLPASDSQGESTYDTLAPAVKQTVPTHDEIKALRSKKQELVSRHRKAKQFKQEGQDTILDKLALQINEINTQLQELVNIRDAQIDAVADTEGQIEEVLSRNAVVAPQTRKKIIHGIMIHCGLLVPDSVATSGQSDHYTERSKLRIALHQQKAAAAKAEEIAEYLESGKLPTAEGVYRLLTKEPPLSATEYGRTEFTEQTPPHLLHKTDFKAELEKAFALEELATHENRSDDEDFNHEVVQQDVRNILSKSGRMISADDHKQLNDEALAILSAHVVVSSGVAKFEDSEATESDSLSSSVVTGNEVLQAEQVAQARQLAHQLVNEMNRAGIQPKQLAELVYPKDKKMRTQFISELKPVWTN